MINRTMDNTIDSFRNGVRMRWIRMARDPVNCNGANQQHLGCFSVNVNDALANPHLGPVTLLHSPSFVKSNNHPSTKLLC